MSGVQTIAINTSFTESVVCIHVGGKRVLTWKE